jgi:hypothetical protein
MYSRINNQYKYDETTWVVSLVNTGKGSIGELYGHAVIIVEGRLCNGLIFFGEYDIMATVRLDEQSMAQRLLGNITGDISEIRCNPTPSARANQNTDLAHAFRDYENLKYSAKSWYVASREGSKNALKMIEAIEADFSILEMEKSAALIARRHFNSPFKYQVAGAHRWNIWGGNKGHNCLTYAEEKLSLAGAGNTKILTDSSKASTQIHIRCHIL